MWLSAIEAGLEFLGWFASLFKPKTAIDQLNADLKAEVKQDKEAVKIS